MNKMYFNNAGKLVIENISGKQVIFRNFQGKTGKYNKDGERNFCVVLDDIDFARQLKEEGWTVTIREATEEFDKPRAHLKVKVRFDNIPPVIHLVTSNSNILMDEEAVGMLDWAEIVNVDMVINPSPYSNPARSGIAAYLRSMYVTIEEDPFEEKYARREDDIPF